MATDTLAALDDIEAARDRQREVESAERQNRDRESYERFLRLADAWYKIGEMLRPGETFRWKPWIESICEFCATAKAEYANEPIDWTLNVDRVLKSIEAPASDIDALCLIHAGFAGGKRAVKSKLLEFSKSDNKRWSSIFRSIGSDGMLRYILNPEQLEKWRAIEREAESASAASHAPETIELAEQSGIVDLSNRMYRIGTNEQLVSRAEDDVLQAFLEVSALDSADLISATESSRAPRVLRELCTKYGGMFAPAITLAGRKGAGYVVRITPAE